MIRRRKQAPSSGPGLKVIDWQVPARLQGPARDRMVGRLLFLPFAFLMAALAGYPIFWVLRASFFQQGLLSTDRTFVWLDNFSWAVTSGEFWSSLLKSIYFAGGTVVVQVPIAFGIALMLQQSFLMRGLLRNGATFTFILPMVVAALTFRFMFSDATGILAYYIRELNLPIAGSPFGSPALAMPALILFNSWKNFPLLMLVFLAAIQSINTDLFEAAAIDGASKWQAVRYVTIPQVLPVGIAIVTLRTIWAFNNFQVPFLLTQGGPFGITKTLPLLLYQTVFGSFEMGRGSAMAVMYVLVVLGVSFGYWRLLRWSEEKYG
ncbi:MAG: sugar ABC transporter permease [Dehalococcoidia bacterium]